MDDLDFYDDVETYDHDADYAHDDMSAEEWSAYYERFRALVAHHRVTGEYLPAVGVAELGETESAA